MTFTEYESDHEINAIFEKPEPSVPPGASADHPVVLAIIPIASIVRDLPQARRLWRHQGGREKLDHLVQSVEDWGVIQPVLVSPLPGDKYLLVAGHRRYVAAVRAKQTHLPAIIRNLRPDQARILQLVENVQRAEMSPLDEAQVYADLLEQYKTVAAVARLVGVSHTTVSGKIKVLRDKLVAQGVKDGLVAPSIASQVVSLMEPYDAPIRHKLTQGERVTYDDVLAARTLQGEAGVTNPNALRKEPPRGYYTPANNRAYGYLTPLPNSDQPPYHGAPHLERDEPVETLAEAIEKLQERQQPRYAEERVDPVYAQVLQRKKGAREEAAYSQNPEHVVVERPPSRTGIKAQVGLDRQRILIECHDLSKDLEYPKLMALLEWAGKHAMSASTLANAVRMSHHASDEKGQGVG